jgi:SPP1 gp7 family putative phage head morphogenesis protein
MPKKGKVDPTYQKQIEQVKLDAEEYTDIEMLSVYKEQKKSLDALEVVLGGLFIKYAVDGLLKMTAQEKNSVGIDKTLKNIGKDLGQNEIDKVTNILSNVFKETYYKNAFIMDSGMKVDLKFNILKKEFIDNAVNSKLAGELFSDRIWKNKADMIDKLHNSMINAMEGKTTIDKVARDIKNTFNVTAYQSQRLAVTEMGRIQVDAQEEIARSTGVKQVMWSATLDNRTAEEDALLDGQTWDIDEDHPKPIYDTHPNCRCVLINVPFDGWTPTKRKDNETKEIIDYKTYDQWKSDKEITEE